MGGETFDETEKLASVDCQFQVISSRLWLRKGRGVRSRKRRNRNEEPKYPLSADCSQVSWPAALTAAMVRLGRDARRPCEFS